VLAQRILKKICQVDCDARLALGGMPPSLRMHVAALSRAPCRAADRASSYVESRNMPHTVDRVGNHNHTSSSIWLHCLFAQGHLERR
jgi:hypothetical protein